MVLHVEKIDDKGETKAHRKMGRKMVLKQMGRFLGNSLTVYKRLRLTSTTHNTYPLTKGYSADGFCSYV